MPTTSIKTVWEIVRFLCKKNNTAYLDPDQFNLVINRAQMTKFMEMYGNPVEYQPGAPAPRVAYEVTQKVTDDLKQFKQEKVLTINKYGQAPYPENYVHTLSLGSRYYKQTEDCKEGETEVFIAPIEVVNQDKEMQRRASRIVGPTKKSPICILKDTYFQFYPENIGSVQLSYLRQPREARYGVTIVSGRPVYDQATSVDLEWPDVAVNDIVMRALSYIGLSIKDGDITQYAETKKQTGA
jgi:hypothetical protein